MVNWFKKSKIVVKLGISLLLVIVIMIFPVLVIRSMLLLLINSPKYFTFNLFVFDESNTITFFDYLSMYLTIIGVLVSGFLTYAIFNFAKKKEKTEFQKYRATVFYQTMQSINECIHGRPSGIILMDSIVNTSLSLREVLNEEEFSFLNEMWKQLQTISSIRENKDELDRQTSILKNKIYIPLYWIIIKDFVNIFTDDDFNQIDLLNEKTLTILGKIGISNIANSLVTKKYYIDGSLFIEPYDFKNGGKIKYKIYKKNLLIYDGEFANGLFTGKGQKIENRTYYEGYFLESKKSGSGVERTLDKQKKLKEGEWLYDKFVRGTMYDVYLSAASKYNKLLGPSHFTRREIPEGTDPSIIDTKKIGDVELDNNGNSIVKNVRTVNEISVLRSVTKSIASIFSNEVVQINNVLDYQGK